MRYTCQAIAPLFSHELSAPNSASSCPDSQSTMELKHVASAPQPSLALRLSIPLQMDDLLSRLSMAKDKISDTEDLISIDLDHRCEAAGPAAVHASLACMRGRLNHQPLGDSQGSRRG